MATLNKMIAESRKMFDVDWHLFSYVKMDKQGHTV